MRFVASICAIAFAFAADAAPDIAGAAYCDRSGSDSECRVGWRWTANPPSYQSVQRLDVLNNRWWVIEETAGLRTGKTSAPVESGHLYRVRACGDPIMDSTCVESSAFWAPLKPKTAAEIPQLVVTRRGRMLQVVKTLPLEQQSVQFNLYQLAAELEDVSPEHLPPMTAPAKRWGAKDFTAADSLANSIYEDYAEFRKPREARQQANPYGAKEFISDVPPAEWAQFRAKRLQGWAEETAITFEPKDVRYSINVFADITCEHCAQMEKDLDQLSSLGIRVRFFAYPLAGPNTPVGRRMADVWCAQDPQSSLRLALLNQTVPAAECTKPVVPLHFALARQLGLPGSPSVLNEKGELIGGYLPPNELLRVLESH